MSIATTRISLSSPLDKLLVQTSASEMADPCNPPDQEKEESNSEDVFISFGQDSGGSGLSSSSPLSLITHSPAPWLTNFTFEHSSASIQNLHCECLEFCRFISLTEEELATRSTVMNEIQTIVNDVFPNTRLQYFGSQLSKTLTPSSDLDLVIMGIDVKNPLFVLAEHIKKADIASYLEVISNAKVPIVKFDHRDSGISVDILVNNDDGLTTGKLIQRLSREFPPLRPLIVILKTFLSQRKLNDTYTGGVGSFVLSIMIVSFLQHRQKILSFQQISSATWNLGSLLIEFFYLYGVTFNYEEVGISIANGGSYFRKRSRQGEWWNPQRPYLLAIENPNYPEIDMGRSSFNIYRIKRAFDHAYQVLICALSQENVPSLLSFIIRPNDPVFMSRKQMLGASLKPLPSTFEQHNFSKNQSNDQNNVANAQQSASTSDISDKKKKSKKASKRLTKKSSNKDKGEGDEDDECVEEIATGAGKDGRKRKRGSRGA